MDGGGNGKQVVQGQQKTHTSLESVGLVFKVYRFRPIYFAVIYEVLVSCKPLISLTILVALHGFEPRTCGL
jgi:hypothetical protein